MWVYRQDEQAASNPVGGIRAIVGSDTAFANSTGGTPAAIPNFVVPMRLGQIWVIETEITCLGVSGGGKLSVSFTGAVAPSLLSIVTAGLTSGITASSTDTTTAIDTLSAAYNTSAVTGLISQRVTIAPAANGSLTFNCANVTNSNSFLIKGTTYMIATRIA